MTSILFVRKPHVYLPEIAAYRGYLAKYFPGVSVCESTDMQGRTPEDFDIHWHFMGFDIAGKGRYTVHEYNSLSTPPFPRLKNAIKKLLNKKPQRRVFLNETVRRDFGFHDGVPSHIRDMGIDERFFGVAKKPAYDFILAGGLGRGAVVGQVLDCFAAGKMRGMSLVLIGDPPQGMKEKYAEAQNIVFAGRKPYHEMPAMMGTARYALNIQPDLYPFNAQTSTKLIEYCAAGMPVVTTDYAWARDFEKNHGAAFFKLNESMNNFDPAALGLFAFKVPDVSVLKWETIIAESGVFSFLKTDGF